MVINCPCGSPVVWWKKIPELMKGLGKGINEFKKGKNESEDKTEEKLNIKLKVFRSFQDLQARLFNNEFTCEELVKFYLNEIKTKDNYNAFIETFDDSSYEQARVVDRDILNNKKKRLSGLIIGIKDNICYKNHVVTASSLILKDFKSLYSATAVNKLIEEGAIVIGGLIVMSLPWVVLMKTQFMAL